MVDHAGKSSNGLFSPFSINPSYWSHQLGSEELNRTRIIFSLLDQNTIDQVSEVTGGDFGSSINNYKLSSVRNTWGQLACVGLLLFIVINERNSPCRPNRAREPKRPPKCNVREPKLPPKRNVRQPKLPLKPNIRVRTLAKRSTQTSITKGMAQIKKDKERKGLIHIINVLLLCIMSSKTSG